MEQKLYDAASALPKAELDFHAIQDTPRVKSSRKIDGCCLGIASLMVNEQSIGQKQK